MSIWIKPQSYESPAVKLWRCQNEYNLWDGENADVFTLISSEEDFYEIALLGRIKCPHKR